MSDEKVDISGFMIKEYEHLAEAYFNSHEIMAKWVKFYLIVMAAPLSLIALIYRDKPTDFNIFAMSESFAILIGLIGLLGLLIALIIMNARLDATLYAQSVNGIRKYFWDKERAANKLLNITIDESKYRVLPDDVKQPKYLKFSDLIWLTLLMGLINSFYLTIGLTQLEICRIFIPAIAKYSIIIFILLIVMHIAYYLIAACKKEEKHYL